jgi:hypothetical protein
VGLWSVALGAGATPVMRGRFDAKTQAIGDDDFDCNRG